MKKLIILFLISLFIWLFKYADEIDRSHFKAEVTIDEPFFSVIKEVKFDGTIEQAQNTRNRLIVTVKNDSSDQTTVYAFDYQGERLWERKFEAGKIVRIITSETSENLLVRIPIPRDVSGDTGLRECQSYYLNKEGKEVGSFKTLCFDGVLPGDHDYFVTNPWAHDGTYTGIFNISKEDYVHARERVLHSTGMGQMMGAEVKPNDSFKSASDSIRLEYSKKIREVQVYFENKLRTGNRNDRAKMNEIRREMRASREQLEQEMDVQIRNNPVKSIPEIKLIKLGFSSGEVERDSLIIETDSLEIDFGLNSVITDIRKDSESGLTYLRMAISYSLGSNSQGNNYIFVINESGRLKYLFEAGKMLSGFELLPDEKVLLSYFLPEKAGFYSFKMYDLNLKKVLSESEAFFTNGNPNIIALPSVMESVLLVGGFGFGDRCNTDVKKLDFVTMELACVELFDNFETLFHPTLIQNPISFQDFVFVNSKNNRLVFAELNR